MTFKEQAMGEDLDIFLNMDEFADEHKIGYGREEITVRAVLQSPTAKELFLSGSDKKYRVYDGLYGTEAVLHCRKADLPEVPAEGEVLKVDGKIYLVDSCVDDMGILSITLQASERR